MHLLLMALISTVTVNEVTLDTDLIENIDGQWIATGYRLIEELVLDPGDYGTPLLNPSGNRNKIGFQPFFVDTPDGEKWRIVHVFEDEVVVLQEDTEPGRFPITGEIRYMMNSANGRYVLLGLEEEERTHEDLISQPFAESERRVILLDIETGDQVTATGIKGVGFVGNDGFVVSIKNDSIEFYNSSLSLIGTTFNCIRELSGTPTSYASDGSLFVRQFKENPDDTTWVLRAYDRYSNVLWDSYPPYTGYPMVSEHGEYVFVLTIGRILCLNGNDGSLLWEMQHNDEGHLMIYSRVGSVYAFETDVTPAEVRANPLRERVLNIGRIELENEPIIQRLVYQSDKICSFSPISLSSSGCSIWRVFFGRRPNINMSIFTICIFSTDGSLIFSRLVTTADRRYGNIWANLSRSLLPYAIDATGKRIIWWDRKEIHIVTLLEEGASE